MTSFKNALGQCAQALACLALVSGFLAYVCREPVDRAEELAAAKGWSYDHSLDSRVMNPYLDPSQMTLVSVPLRDHPEYFQPRPRRRCDKPCRRSPRS